jgi:hypothetical protein
MIMEKLNTDRKSLRKFGITLGIVFVGLTLLIIVRHKLSPMPTAIISGIFLVFAFIAPTVLKPIYIFWMGLAHTLGYINTRLILFILFYIIFTPIGICIRLCGGDLLSKKIAKNAASYWIKKENRPFKASDYERQF